MVGTQNADLDLSDADHTAAGLLVIPFSLVVDLGITHLLVGEVSWVRGAGRIGLGVVDGSSN